MSSELAAHDAGNHDERTSDAADIDQRIESRLDRRGDVQVDELRDRRYEQERIGCEERFDRRDAQTEDVRETRVEHRIEILLLLTGEFAEQRRVIERHAES